LLGWIATPLYSLTATQWQQKVLATEERVFVEVEPPAEGEELVVAVYLIPEANHIEGTNVTVSTDGVPHWPCNAESKLIYHDSKNFPDEWKILTSEAVYGFRVSKLVLYY
jgi:hypothetical protein